MMLAEMERRLQKRHRGYRRSVSAARTIAGNRIKLIEWLVAGC
jgi:hypothetical protein